MRDKIREVLHKHDQDPFGVYMHDRRSINAEKATDELTVLMCYREVRAYWMAFNDFNDDGFYSGIEEEIVGAFSDDYPEKIIRNAIEQYKNEQK